MILTFDLSEDIKESIFWIESLINKYPDHIGTQEIHNGLIHIINNYKNSKNNVLSINLSGNILESIYWEISKWIEINGSDAWINCILDCELPEIEYYKLNNFAEDMVTR